MKVVCMEYLDALNLQKKAVSRLLEKKGGEVAIILTHPPTITLGRKGKIENIKFPLEVLESRGIAVFKTERGGDVTYHGPGQIVCYPIIDLNLHHLSPPEHISNLENVMKETLQKFGIDAFTIEGMRGVFVGEGSDDKSGEQIIKKIGAVGVAVTRGVCFHGFALNVFTDPHDFDVIVPCGIAKYQVTSMSRCISNCPSIEEVADVLYFYLRLVYGEGLLLCP